MLQLNLCQVGRYFYNPNAAEILPQHRCVCVCSIATGILIVCQRVIDIRPVPDVSPVCIVSLGFIFCLPQGMADFMVAQRVVQHCSGELCSIL